MLRRLLITATLIWPLALLAGAAPSQTEAEPDSAPALPRYTASKAQLQTALAQRFPLRYPVPGVVALLNTYAPALAERSMLEVVLHQLQPKDLALADVMGLVPGSITVTDSGLVIGFVNKPL